MKQRAKFLIELPENMNVEILLGNLRLMGCRSEVLKTLYPISPIPTLESFKFIDEKEIDGVNCWTGKKIERANQVP